MLPVCDMYEKMTEIGPKMMRMMRSPRAMYLSPMPPVYKKDDESPPK